MAGFLGQMYNDTRTSAGIRQISNEVSKLADHRHILVKSVYKVENLIYLGDMSATPPFERQLRSTPPAV